MSTITDWSDFEIGEELVSQDERRREEWMAARYGKITCSRFGDIIGTGRSGERFTKTGLKYLRSCVAQKLGSFEFDITGPALTWGNDNEEKAIEEYSARIGRPVTANREFVLYTDDVGGTPDAMVGSNGTLEVKCPYNPSVHVETLLSQVIPDNYRWQVVGHCLVTGRDWCDFVSFDPRIEGPERLFVVRWNRDEEDILLLKKRLAEAVGWIRESIEKIAAVSCDVTVNQTCEASNEP